MATPNVPSSDDNMDDDGSILLDFNVKQESTRKKKTHNKKKTQHAVSSNNKAYIPNMGGYSIYGSSIDGSDPLVRLDMYMRGENHWKTEQCYMDKHDVESVEKYKSQRDLER